MSGSLLQQQQQQRRMLMCAICAARLLATPWAQQVGPEWAQDVRPIVDKTINLLILAFE
jgi:hypothetical protein